MIIKNNIILVIKISIFVLFLQVLNSCDFIDTQLKLQNNTKRNIFVYGVFIKNNNTVSPIFSPQKISADTTQAIKILNSHLEGIFDYGVNYLNDSTLDIIIFNKPVVYYTSDSHFANKDWYLINELLQTGNYKIRSYTYDELKRKNWLIVYSDDGFKQGWPLNPEK